MVRRAKPWLLNAILAMVAFGIPTLWFAISGRFTLQENRTMSDDWEVLWDARLAALESVLGPSDDSVLHSPVPFELGGPADVLIFREHVEGVVYVTAGVIGDEDALPGDGGQYELMICLRDGEDWAPQLLSQLAMYTREAVLNSGDTMDIGPALPQPTQLSAFLYHSYAAITVNEQPATVLLCVGITKDELAFASKKGSAALIERLKEAGIYPFTDLGRKSVSR